MTAKRRLSGSSDLLAARRMAATAFPAEDNATAGQVVGREFNGDGVSRGDADVVHAHFPGDVGENLLAIL